MGEQCIDSLDIRWTDFPTKKEGPLARLGTGPCAGVRWGTLIVVDWIGERRIAAGRSPKDQLLQSTG
jgi:hypothetical protein